MVRLGLLLVFSLACRAGLAGLACEAASGEGEGDGDRWADVGGCSAALPTSDLDPECRARVGCNAVDVTSCRPAHAAMGRSVWSPEGAQVLLAFLPRYL